VLGDIPLTEPPEDERLSRRWRRYLALGLILAAALGWLTLGGLTLWFLRPAPAEPVPLTTATASAAVEAAKSTPPTPPLDGPYPVAHLPGDVTAYDGPGGAAVGTVAGQWWGYQSILPVIDRSGGFLQVRVQPRPNESTAWIAADGIEITTTPYRIEIDLAARRLKLLELGTVVMDVPALIGRPATPTPAGHFFVTMLQPGPSSGYGALVLVLSAHSETIDNWQGSGDAVSAIHGPLGDEASIDAAVPTTNGCVRLHMADLDALAAIVPPGSPVDIA
jgi:lipoprotein-anchoring transpeptidase ErfK/SrfK